jgi:sugar lactone lactonase YvrE
MHEPFGQQADIEAMLPRTEIDCFLLAREQIEKQRRQADVVKFLRHEPIARTVPAAPAAVHKKHKLARVLRYGQRAIEHHLPGRNFYFDGWLVAVRHNSLIKVRRYVSGWIETNENHSARELRTLGVSALTWFIAVATAFAPGELKEFASFPNQQVTSVAASKTGRVFVNFPRWSDEHGISVAEIVNGQLRPFPSNTWNAEGPAPTHFVCVQSVYVDDDDFLWALDPASPKMQGVVKDGPKLVKVDLSTNKSVDIVPLADVAPTKSYLNDVRIDTKANVAFITESGTGALIVVDLHKGNARRVLDKHPSTKAEPGFKLNVDGRELRDQAGNPPQINADGIALDTEHGYLYYHALTGRALYRIKTEDLENAQLSAAELESKVEKVVETGPTDGMLEVPDGSIYLTQIEENAIARFDPASGKLERVVQDKRVSWPDSMAWGPDGALYVTASQIQNMPRFNNGKSTRTEP